MVDDDLQQIAHGHPSAHGKQATRGRATSPLAVIENALMVALLGATVLIVAAQVAFRYLLHRPLSWSGDAATYLLVWTAFIGLAIGVRERAHISLVLFESRLPARARPWYELFQLLVVAVMLLALLGGGIEFLRSGMHQTAASGIPLWTVYVSIPIGAALSLLHLARQVQRIVRGMLDASRRRRRPASTVRPYETSAGHGRRWPE